MALVKVLRGRQVTLPAEARKALRLKEGDYLEAQVVGESLQLKAVIDRPKWVGPGPEPSEDELMATVVDELHAMRAERDEGRSR
jgi:AbrB family looped-hinge helix DNA binding protein